MVTSFGERLKVVFYTIESIANGSQLPSRLTLWVEKEWLDKGLPDSLQRLQKRGLEIKETENLGPHKKYFPEIMSERGLDQKRTWHVFDFMRLAADPRFANASLV